ncbi:molybdenum cofactor guanylyltransferase [Virgibacillus soli]|uniref:Probable molybdenum cofactor guanylyltransferase n=1 Tax=Paracerasibacillus soli TaxID=480284 RepID=A0ABU5CR38_9BACI|nr:molybdenum cofactor guanylyltransferase [Virgibacillus soli]MDY0408269.1 molybdenum cofactor guanylyltransferase [Virgibacillus soli]
MKTYGAILCGGKSTRMGRNKSLLNIHGKKVIEHVNGVLEKICDHVVLSTNDFSTYQFMQIPMFADRYVDKGPLAGIESVLYHVDADVFVFSACDTPFISEQVYDFLIAQLEKFDAVVPVYNKQIHPLSAIYHKRTLLAIQGQLDKNERRVKSFFQHINVKYVQDFHPFSTDLLDRHFFNMNNPTDYIRAKTF